VRNSGNIQASLASLVEDEVGGEERRGGRKHKGRKITQGRERKQDGGALAFCRLMSSAIKAGTGGSMTIYQKETRAPPSWKKEFGWLREPPALQTKGLNRRAPYKNRSAAGLSFNPTTTEHNRKTTGDRDRGVPTTNYGKYTGWSLAWSGFPKTTRPVRGGQSPENIRRLPVDPRLGSRES